MWWLVLPVASFVTNEGIGEGPVMQSLAGMDFDRVLAKVRQAPAFSQRSAKVVPTFCEGSDHPDLCEQSVEHGLLCKAFMSKAQEFMQGGMPGAAEFVRKCEPIMATSFTDVSGWVEKPSDLFTDLTGRAKRTMAAEDRKVADSYFGAA